jgi:hypothetical protein
MIFSAIFLDIALLFLLSSFFSSICSSSNNSVLFNDLLFNLSSILSVNCFLVVLEKLSWIYFSDMFSLFNISFNSSFVLLFVEFNIRVSIKNSDMVPVLTLSPILRCDFPFSDLNPMHVFLIFSAFIFILGLDPFF